MSPSEHLLEVLSKVQTLTFQSQAERPKNWNGSAEGSVNVTKIHPSVLIFEENGYWTTLEINQKVPIAFFNCYQWEIKSDDQVTLSHLRFGSENPILLFDLKQKQNGSWGNIDAHQCIDDQYQAQLEIQDRQVILHWSIIGPKKEVTITYIYQTRADLSLL